MIARGTREAGARLLAGLGLHLRSTGRGGQLWSPVSGQAAWILSAEFRSWTVKFDRNMVDLGDFVQCSPMLGNVRAMPISSGQSPRILEKFRPHSCVIGHFCRGIAELGQFCGDFD